MSVVLPPKRDVALALLERASVFIHMDPRSEGVMVPNWLKNQSQLVLQVGLNMAVNIPDLDVGEEGISCTLSFSRRPHYCHVPWGAIYALVGEDGRGMIWPDDIPSEVAAQSQQPPAIRSLDAVDAKRARQAQRRAREQALTLAQRQQEQESVEAPSPGAQRSTPASQPPRLVALPGDKTRAGGSTSGGNRPAARPHLRLVK